MFGTLEIAGNTFVSSFLEPIEWLASEKEEIVTYRSGNKTISELRKDGKVIKTAEAKCNTIDVFDFKVGAKLSFDRLMDREEKKEIKAEPKEPINLYCIKSDKDWLTKGKIYEFDGHKINYDNGESAYFNNFEDWKRGDSGLASCLFPLVKRPAKVGEWVLITNSDKDIHNTYKNGDILRAVFPRLDDGVHYKDGECDNRYIYDTEYLVLDGYHGEYETKTFVPYLFSNYDNTKYGNIGEKSNIVDLLGNNLLVGDTVTLYSGTTNYGESVIISNGGKYFVMGVYNVSFINSKSSNGWKIVKCRDNSEIKDGEKIGGIEYILTNRGENEEKN